MECLTGLWRKKVRSCEVLRWKCIKLIHHGQKYCSSFCLFFWLLFSYSLYRTWSGNDRGKVWKIFFLLNLEYVWVWNKLRIISQRRYSKFLLLHSFLYTKLYLLKSGNIHLEKTKGLQKARDPRPGPARAHFWMGQAMGPKLGPARRPATLKYIYILKIYIQEIENVTLIKIFIINYFFIECIHYVWKCGKSLHYYKINTSQLGWHLLICQSFELFNHKNKNKNMTYI